jgi:hypothetical protein
MNLFLSSRPDRQHVAALLKCRGSEDLLEVFRAKLDETKAALVVADDMVKLHRLQGRAEVLQDFLEAVKEAPSILERLR